MIVLQLRNLEKEKRSKRDEMLDLGQQLSVVERNHRVLDAEINSMEQQLKEIETK